MGVLSIFSCKNNEEHQQEKLKRIILTTDLINDSAAAFAYDYYHSPQHIWPEIDNAAKVSGIRTMQIYRLKTRLFMILEFPADADREKMGALYSNSSSRMKEWDIIMNKLQKNPLDTSQKNKWVEMKSVYNYE